MQGLHLTGDLFECACPDALFTDLEALTALCCTATVDSGLTIVDQKFHVFPDWNGEPGGITGTLLLAESHLAIHTWPERRGVTLDVYVCNFTDDNSPKAQQLFDTLMTAFRPKTQVVNRITRGDLAAEVDTVAAQALATAPGGKVEQDQLVFDWLNPRAGYGFTASQKLAEIDSPFQRIEVYDTPQFGKLFRLDGRFMTSEGDEFFYHECITHPALLAHPDPKKVLVIGGGDGGSSEEILKHPSVERVLMAELDAAVIEIAKAHLAGVHHGVFNDPRLEVRIGDGYETVKASQELFDLIVLDLTDPDTPAFHLYTEDFFRLCQTRLAPGGALTLHLGSPVYGAETVKKNAAALARVFRHVAPLSLFIPLYGSLWCLAVASDALDPRHCTPATVAQRIAERGITDLQYYNAALHPALFALPTFVAQLVSPAVAD